MSLPDCEACGKPITFYMHQRYYPDKGMRYWHPECCPEEMCDTNIIKRPQQ